MKWHTAMVLIGCAVLAGCATNYYYDVTMEAATVRLPEAGLVLAALRDDPEVVRVTYERYQPPKEGGAPFDRLLIFSHFSSDNFIITGESRSFEMGLRVVDGKPSVLLGHQYWTQVRGARDDELLKFMKDVYVRLGDRFRELPKFEALHLSIERGTPNF